MLHSEKKQIDLYDDVSNPLDNIEEIMLNNDWQYDRVNVNEVRVTISGMHSDYQMAFLWQEEYSALKVTCTPDVQITQNNMAAALKTINNINASLWLGHFDVQTNASDNNAFAPCFRHTSLFRDQHQSSGMSMMEDLIDIALHECERNMTAFSLLAKTTRNSTSDVALALMETVGAA